MAQQCEVCNTDVYRVTFQGGKWRGDQCGCARSFRIRSTMSPFNLTLTHVHDAFGKPLRVENLQQLQKAETAYGFEHVMANYDNSNAFDPPQQRKISVSDIHRRKFRRGE